MDYKVTDTELTSVANAIRTKGGTSAQLEFPTGFVAAIGNIPSGESSVLTKNQVIYPFLSNGSFITLTANDDYELCVTFVVDALSNDYRLVFGNSDTRSAYFFYSSPWMQIMDSESEESFYIAIPKTSNKVNEFFISSEDVPLSINTRYIAKLSFNHVSKEIEISVSDGTHTKVITETLEQIQYTNYGIVIGGSGAVRIPKEVSFDLTNTYIKLNGNIVWGNKA